MALGFERPTLGMPTSKRLFNVVTKFFHDNQWSYERLEGQPVLMTSFRGASGAWRCAAAVNEEEQQVAFFAMLDTKVAAEHRPAVVEFLTRANYGLGMGNFEIDLSDGEVRCKTCLAVAGVELTVGLLRNLIQCNWQLMDRYSPSLRKVARGEMSPDAAVAQAERPAA